jgi:hypothetical protein
VPVPDAVTSIGLLTGLTAVVTGGLLVVRRRFLF